MSENYDIVTREELYEQAWATPMVELAKKYRLSDVGLAKLYKELKIPRPPVGHWAKVQAGKRVRRKRLPKAKEGAPTAMRFNLDWQPPSRQNLAPEFGEWLEESKRILTAVVPKTLEFPHPLVADALKVFGRAKSNQGHLERGYQSIVLDLRVSESSLDRALRIMDALLGACESLGVTIELSTDRANGMSATKDGVGVRFWLHEKIERRKLPKKRNDFFTDHEYLPTGIMCVRIPIQFGKDTRRVWADGTKQRLEDCVVAIAIGLARAVESERVCLIERAERERQWALKREEERRIAEERARIRREEEERRADLIDECDRWHQAKRIREYLEAVKDNSAGDCAVGPTKEWLEWSTRFADELDPLSDQQSRTEGTPRMGRGNHP